MWYEADDELDEREYPGWPDAADVGPEDDDADDETEPCPHCGKPVYHDAERCYFCGMYLSREDAPAHRRPWWFVLGVVLSLAVVGWWILSFFRF